MSKGPWAKEVREEEKEEKEEKEREKVREREEEKGKRRRRGLQTGRAGQQGLGQCRMPEEMPTEQGKQRGKNTTGEVCELNPKKE